MLKGFIVSLRLEEFKQRMGSMIHHDIDVTINQKENTATIQFITHDLDECKDILKNVLHFSQQKTKKMISHCEPANHIKLTLRDASKWIANTLNLTENIRVKKCFIDKNDNKENIIIFLYEPVN